MNKKKMEIKGENSGEVVLETSVGEITFELYWNHAPKTCKNFWTLAERGYYNNTIFHRVVKDFIVQGGDPTGSGRGGASIYGDKFEDEITKELKHVGAGILRSVSLFFPLTLPHFLIC